jgi:Uma2 family endonuclease
MAVVERMDPRAYERVAASGGVAMTELHEGVPIEKPRQAEWQRRMIRDLAIAIGLHLPREEARLWMERARLSVPGGNYYLPDLVVLPRGRGTPDPGPADVVRAPALLVVELWSPSAGGYDQRDKIGGYMLRGDVEIWLLQPSGRTLNRWRRRSDGQYDELAGRYGIVSSSAIPQMQVDLAALFGG